MLNWLSNHDFRVAENGEHLAAVVQETDQNENPQETQPRKQSVSSEVKKLAQSLERSSTGVSNSLTSVKRTLQKQSSVQRSESIQDRIKKFSLTDESIQLPVFKKLTFATPTTQESSKVDSNNNTVKEKFVPMADRIQEYETELNDEVVLSKLQDVVRSRRELFDSPNSTLERPLKSYPKKVPQEKPPQEQLPQDKPQMANGSLGKHILVKQKNSHSKPSLNPDEIKRKIAEIEREIRENEARLQALPLEPPTQSLDRPKNVKITNNDSFLSRLTPRSEAQHSVEKVDVLRQLGLPLDEQHNVESYLSQFSLEGEFV